MISMKRAMWLVLCVVFFCVGSVCADEIHFKNGDKISGEILVQDAGRMVIRTEAMGELIIEESFVREVVTPSDEVVAAMQDAVEWTREVAIGYSRSTGNTENEELSGRLQINRKTDDDEFTVKANGTYAASNEKMDTQKYYGMVRYAASFSQRKWYRFAQLEGDHDRFANVNYRIIPSVGVGYWFSDTDDWKAMVEGALGVEYTDYRSGTGSSTEVVVVPRLFLEKRLFGESRIRQDVTLYPKISDFGEFRLHSETVFVNPVTENVSLNMSLIDDYNSDPAKGTKKNDVRFITSLVYTF